MQRQATRDATDVSIGIGIYKLTAFFILDTWLVHFLMLYTCLRAYASLFEYALRTQWRIFPVLFSNKITLYGMKSTIGFMHLSSSDKNSLFSLTSVIKRFILSVVICKTKKIWNYILISMNTWLLVNKKMYIDFFLLKFYYTIYI